MVVNALRALALLGDPRAVPAVAGHVGSASAAIRVEALRALAALPADRGLRERIVGELASDQPAVRAAALLALAKVDREDFALVLSSLDPDPSPAVRAGLAAALAEIGDEASVAILHGMLKDAGSAARWSACWRRSARCAARRPRTPCAATSSTPTSRCARPRSRAWPRSRSPAWARPSRRSTRGPLNDADIDVRLAVVDALAALTDERSRGHAARRRAERSLARGARARRGGAAAPRSWRRRIPARWRWTGRRSTTARPWRPTIPRPTCRSSRPRAILHTRHGPIEIHLNVVEAPLTVASFIDLARRGFYDGLTFHRVVPRLRDPGRRPARRRQRRPRLHAALRDRPAALRPRRGGHGALAARTPAAASSSSPTPRRRTSTAATRCSAGWRRAWRWWTRSARATSSSAWRSGPAGDGAGRVSPLPPARPRHRRHAAAQRQDDLAPHAGRGRGRARGAACAWSW